MEGTQSEFGQLVEGLVVVSLTFPVDIEPVQHRAAERLRGSSGVCHVDTLDLAVEGEGRLAVVVQRHRRAEADADVEAVVGGE